MAAVYLGRAVGAGGFERRVAIKVMHEHIADDPDFVAMFLDEARLAARIHHPNVVGTIDVQKSDEGMFLVMEYIEGASLKGVLRGMRKRRQRIPYGITVRIICDALSGLHAAHELKGKGGKAMNLVHRDVSPHNILVGTDGVSRITDFGVARAEARLSTTRGGQLKGKIAYMPPEQGLGNDVDRRADLYAAGVVLWEMLVGRRLFKADHDGQLVAMILQGADRCPRDVIEDIPEPLNDVCMKALALRPDDRYATAAHFAEALESALYDAGIRVASTRQVAAFVDEFKVEITNSVPPARPPEESITGIDSVPSGAVELASMPEPSNESSVDGQAASVAGLVSAGNTIVRRRRKKMYVYGAAAAFALVTAGLIIVLGGGGTAPAAAPAGSQEPEPVASSAEPTPEAPPDPSATQPDGADESSDAGDAPKPDESSKKGDEPPPPDPETPTPPGPKPPVTPYQVPAKPTARPKNPLDFDTSEL